MDTDIQRQMPGLRSFTFGSQVEWSPSASNFWVWNWQFLSDSFLSQTQPSVYREVKLGARLLGINRLPDRSWALPLAWPRRELVLLNGNSQLTWQEALATGCGPYNFWEGEWHLIVVLWSLQMLDFPLVISCLLCPFSLGERNGKWALMSFVWFPKSPSFLSYSLVTLWRYLSVWASPWNKY